MDILHLFIQSILKLSKTNTDIFSLKNISFRCMYHGTHVEVSSLDLLWGSLGQKPAHQAWWQASVLPTEPSFLPTQYLFSILMGKKYFKYKRRNACLQTGGEIFSSRTEINYRMYVSFTLTLNYELFPNFMNS